MRLNPTTTTTRNDWRVHVDYIAHNGARRHRIIAASPLQTEEQALWNVLNSLMVKGVAPQIIDMRAVRRYKDPTDELNKGQPDLLARFVTGAA